MSDKNFVYLIVAIVVAHFIFGVAYLVWKIYTAPKSDGNESSQNDSNEKNEY